MEYSRTNSKEAQEPYNGRPRGKNLELLAREISLVSPGLGRDTSNVATNTRSLRSCVRFTEPARKHRITFQPVLSGRCPMHERRSRVSRFSDGETADEVGQKRNDNGNSRGDRFSPAAEREPALAGVHDIQSANFETMAHRQLLFRPREPKRPRNGGLYLHVGGSSGRNEGEVWEPREKETDDARFGP